MDGSDVPVDDVVTLVLNTCTCRLDNNLSIFTTKIVGVSYNEGTTKSPGSAAWQELCSPNYRMKLEGTKTWLTNAKNTAESISHR